MLKQFYIFRRDEGFINHLVVGNATPHNIDLLSQKVGHDSGLSVKSHDEESCREGLPNMGYPKSWMIYSEKSYSNG